jgi:hypothetical protein
LAVVAPAISASAATSTIKVTVKGGSGLAQDFNVNLYEVLDGYPQYETGVLTNNGGVATFSGMRSGHKYVVEANVFGNQDSQTLSNGGDLGDYGSTWLGSSSSYDYNAAGSFNATSSVSKTVSLKAGYSTMGVITNPGADPITGDSVFVQAFRYVDEGDYEYFANAGSTYSDSSDGTYRVSSLRPGEYVFF